MCATEKTYCPLFSKRAGCIYGLVQNYFSTFPGSNAVPLLRGGITFEQFQDAARQCGDGARCDEYKPQNGKDEKTNER